MPEQTGGLRSTRTERGKMMVPGEGRRVADQSTKPHVCTQILSKNGHQQFLTLKSGPEEVMRGVRPHPPTHLASVPHSQVQPSSPHSLGCR